MPRPSQKAAILAAALHCFSEQGYEGTRIRQIADRAGVTEGALYRHYASKEAIARDLFIGAFQSFGMSLAQIADSDLRPDEQIRQVVRTSLASYRDQPESFRFVLLRGLPSAGPMPADTIYPLDVVERIVQAGQQAGLIRAGQPNLLAALIFGCIMWPITVALNAGSGVLDLQHTDQHDEVIAAAAWAAVARSAP